MSVWMVRWVGEEEPAAMGGEAAMSPVDQAQMEERFE